jgi:hypothetical protein
MRTVAIWGLLFVTACACKQPGAAPQPSPSPTVTPSPSPVAMAPDAGPVALDPAAQRAACCTQCAAAAMADPSAVNLSVSPCTRFLGIQINGAPALDDACGEFFADQAELSVGECRGDPVEP